ncbi:MAG: hypothetical protein IPM39_27370 [Chloroflexi bacterium]|nr:hypothetical protein [Chloroflexota bacterium]
MTAASPELLAANRRLYQLRTQTQAQRPAACALAEQSALARPQANPEPVVRLAAASPADGERGFSAAVPCPETAALPQIIASLPAHLGWGSEPLAAVLRRAVMPVMPQPPAGDDVSPGARFAPQAASGGLPPERLPCCPSVKLYPDIGLAMLRHEMSAPGRLWLMLHHLDPEGRGVFRVDIIRQQLTNRNSELYLCGKRQMRNLLRDGEGLFWTRDKTHIWLHSTARVAHVLGVARLSGRPVALPVNALLEGIGAFRAHLYAAFHSGRVRAGSGATKGRSPEGQAVPIARDTLAGLSGVGRSSQRAYEARLRLRPQANFAIGETASEMNKEERAWHQGQALFELRDYRGEQGKQGKSYLAWQLPNSYGGQHQQRPKGRQKRINRQLEDLVMKGMPGNIETEGEVQQPEKRYYPNGRSAGQARGPRVGDVRYWRQHKTKNGRFILWRPVQGS